jgi:DNA repair protein RecO (recombination protein O)
LRQFLLLVGGLRTLVDGEHTPRLVLDAFLLRSLAVAGYAPALDECAICGTRTPPGPSGPASLGSSAPGRRTFGIAAGGLVCRNCQAPGAALASLGTIELMTALLRGEWGLADASERRYQVECSGLVAAYVQWHLEHSLRSLRHVEHA